MKGMREGRGKEGDRGEKVELESQKPREYHYRTLFHLFLDLFEVERGRRREGDNLVGIRRRGEKRLRGRRLGRASKPDA